MTLVITIRNDTLNNESGCRHRSVKQGEVNYNYCNYNYLMM